MLKDKIDAAESTQSLVLTAIKWINLEFPVPDEGFEYQTVQEILNELRKSSIALNNFIAHLRAKKEEEITQ